MHALVWWSTLIVLTIATVSDIRTNRIPNWLVVPFLLGGLVVSSVNGGAGGLLRSLEGVLLGGALLGVFYLLGGMGMGDVKLCAAIGAWIGPSQLVMALLFMGFAGGVIAFLYALRGGFLKQSFSGVGDLVLGFRKRGFRAHEDLVLANPQARKLPYAPAIAIGTMLSFFALS